MGIGDRISAAWAALTGSAPSGPIIDIPPPALPPAEAVADVPEARGVFESSGASGAGGLLAGVTQQGAAARRGTPALLAAYNAVPLCRQSVGKISSMVGSVGWRMFVSSQKRETGRMLGRRLRGMSGDYNAKETRAGLIKKGLDDGDLREINHPYLQLIDAPNSVMSGPAFRELSQIYLDLTGESFWLKDPIDGGAPEELWPTPPHWVVSLPTKEKPTYRFQRSRWQKDCPEDSVAFFKHMNPLDPYNRGTGIGGSLSDELDGDEWAAKHIAGFFKNGAKPDAILNIQGAGDDQIKKARLDWQSQNLGIHAAHRMHFMNADGIELKDVDADFGDLPIVELRKFYGDFIREMYGIPPEIFGHLESSNKATITAAQTIMALFVLVPRLEFMRIEQQMKVLPWYPNSERLILDYEDPVPRDREHQLEVMKAQPSAFKADEWREMAGRLPLENDDGQVFGVTANVFYVDSLSSAMFDTEEPADDPEPADDDDDDKAAPARGARKTIDPVSIDIAIQVLDPIVMAEHTNTIYEDIVEDFGRKMMDEIATEISFNVISPQVIEHIQSASFDRVGGMVTATTRGKLRDALMEGVLEGEGIPELSKRIRAVFSQASKARSQMIARTEVNRSANFGRWQGMAQSGLVTVRLWLATLDSRTRDTHLELNENTARIDQPFCTTGGACAMYPGDFGDPGEDANCRCTTIPVIDEETSISVPNQKRWVGKESEARELAIFQRRLPAWEVKMRRALRAGFAEQEKAVLQAIEALER